MGPGRARLRKNGKGGLLQNPNGPVVSHNFETTTIYKLISILCSLCIKKFRLHCKSARTPKAPKNIYCMYKCVHIYIYAHTSSHIYIHHPRSIPISIPKKTMSTAAKMPHIPKLVVQKPKVTHSRSFKAVVPEDVP